MKMPRIILIIGLTVMFVTAIASAALAEGVIFPVPIKNYQGVKYMSGGFGYDERAALQKKSKSFNLKLVFSVKGGAYLNNVSVQIKGASGQEILQATSEGPWFYAELTPGTYRVTVAAKGISKGKTARVPSAGQAMLHFVWGN